MDPSPLRRALLAHYDRERRDLPWRGETDPYRVLVSEVMLQQTRAETVERYYLPWLRRFPDLESLAAAELDDVLEAWAGLGYYRRARNLHRTALVVRERAPAGGTPRLPASPEALRALPGIGEYTAGAVASIAFGEPVPAVDGNTRRVLARLFDVADPKLRWLRGQGAALVDPDRPGDWNQALMDLGATICTPRGPACDRCPVATWCGARERGTVEERPTRVPGREVPAKHLALAVLMRAGRVLLAQRPADGLLGGMWAFPEREVRDEREASAAVLEMARAAGLSPQGEPEALGPVDHRFTHLRATYLPRLVEVRERSRAGPSARAARWVAPGASPGVALPAAQKRVLALAGEAIGRRSRRGPGRAPSVGTSEAAGAGDPAGRHR